MTIMPPWPDAATLEAAIWWAVGGAAFGFGAVIVQWLSQRVLRKVPVDGPLHIPGAPKTDDPAPAPWSEAGLVAAALGAAVGFLGAWGWYGPDEVQRRIGVIFAVVGGVRATWKLLRVVRDAPAVGEAPPDDPDSTVAARLPSAWGGIAMAGLGVVMALF